MAITITDKALQEFTDYFQDPVNKYLLLYSRKLVFNDGVTILGTAGGTVIPVLGFDILDVGTKQPVYNIDGDDTSGIKHYLVLNNEGQKEFFYYYEESGAKKGRSQLGTPYDLFFLRDTFTQAEKDVYNKELPDIELNKKAYIKKLKREEQLRIQKMERAALRLIQKQEAERIMRKEFRDAEEKRKLKEAQKRKRKTEKSKC